jgi:parallel beta-helix repeat protein
MDHRASRPSTLARCFTPVLLALLAWAPRAAHADTQRCSVVNSLPAVLSVPNAHYCLARDFTPSLDNGQRAILIDADGIVLDCRGFLVRNNNAQATVPGITAIDRYRVTIRNCVVDGFTNGIQVYSEIGAASTGNVVEDNLVRNSERIGIFVSGSSHRIVGNRVFRTSRGYCGVSYGLALESGRDNQVRDNVVADTRPAAPSGACGTTLGISLSDQQDAQVTGNTVSGLYASAGSPVIGIEAYASLRTVLSDNTVLSAPPQPSPLDGAQAYGLLLTGTLQEQASNVCTGNTVGHFEANITGCLDAGNTAF